MRALRATITTILSAICLTVGATAAGCGAETGEPIENEPAAVEETAPTEGVEVPDALSGDGADAVSAVEAAGLSPLLEDSTEDPNFDSDRDATGCEVMGQEPTVGDLVDEGAEVVITVSCAQVDWENREGSVWESFSDAYSEGFDAGCGALFAESPDGALYEDDDEYSIVDCQGEKPGDAEHASEVPDDAPDDPEGVGTEVGERDGCAALFENRALSSLSYGEISFTSADCPIGGGTQSTAPGASAGGGSGETGSASSTQREGGTCSAQDSSGVAITLEVDSGEVSCSGAEALWKEYLRRAPNEGVGSGGAVEFDGWSCISAPPVQAPRAGGCAAHDDSGSFTVFTGE